MPGAGAVGSALGPGLAVGKEALTVFQGGAGKARVSERMEDEIFFAPPPAVENRPAERKGKCA